MSDILDRIDAAIGCQQCTGPLGNSPSGDFCGETCQVAWHAARSEPLPFEHCWSVIDETYHWPRVLGWFTPGEPCVPTTAQLEHFVIETTRRFTEGRP